MLFEPTTSKNISARALRVTRNIRPEREIGRTLRTSRIFGRKTITTAARTIVETTNTPSKGFKRLVDKLESGDVLIVTKLDRLGRNAIDVVLSQSW
jgi:hypothetical protein